MMNLYDVFDSTNNTLSPVHTTSTFVCLFVLFWFVLFVCLFVVDVDVDVGLLVVCLLLLWMIGIVLFLFVVVDVDVGLLVV